MTEPAARPTSDSALDHALALAAVGLRVVPIKPGGKHPPVAAWQKAATTDAETITNWWTQLYRDHGVGIVLGTQPDGRCIFAVDLDRHHPEADGHETLAGLEAEHEPLPATVRSTTGGDGSHQLFAAPPGVVVRNQRSDGGRVGPGVDIRGEGGQIVVAPSVHASGKAYVWDGGHAPWEHTIAEAPEWLLRLVDESPAERREPPSNLELHRTAGDTPADRLREQWDWPTELSTAGWTHHHTDSSGDQHWVRPGKALRDGSSAVLHPGGPLVVFTTEIPAHWRQIATPTKDGTGWAFSPFDFFAATRHQGDLSAASKALNDRWGVDLASLVDSQRSQTSGNTEQLSNAYDDALLEQIIDWDEFWTQDHSAEDWLVEPVLAARRSHAIYAPGGTGKSLFSLWLAAHMAIGLPIFGRPVAPKRILYLDYEMTADDLAERLDSIGIDSPEALKRLHYALLPSLPAADTPEGGAAICRLAELVDAEVVVLDTFGRAVMGDENDADTVRNFYRVTGSRLKKAGRAFVRIDHAGKDLGRGQRGSSAKNDDVDVVWQLVKSDVGITLKAQKRRMGWVPEVVEMTLTDEPLTYDMAVRPGFPAGTAEMIALLDELGIDPDLSARKVVAELREAGHKARDRVVRAAVKCRSERLENLTKSAAQKAGPRSNSGRDNEIGPRWAAPPGDTPQTVANTEKHRGPKNRAAAGRGETPIVGPRPPLRGAAPPRVAPKQDAEPVDNSPKITLEDL